MIDRYAERIKTAYAERVKTGIIRPMVLSLYSLLFIPFSLYAWEYESQATETTQNVQIRLGAEATKKWNNGLRLGLEQELYSDVYNSATGPAFRTSFTTLCFAYHPIEYVKLDVGYVLKINGPLSTWSAAKKADPNEWIRHRVFASVTGSYSTRYVKFYLRERALMEIRTDSINPLEKSQYAWQLRSRLGADILIPGKPVKPYIWCELVNTLNTPEYQQKNGHQFITMVRPQVGIKWRISKLSSLDFYYRFIYEYDRDVNITKKNGYIELTEKRDFTHAIGVAYNINW